MDHLTVEQQPRSEWARCKKYHEEQMKTRGQREVEDIPMIINIQIISEIK